MRWTQRDDRRPETLGAMHAASAIRKCACRHVARGRMTHARVRAHRKRGAHLRKAHARRTTIITVDAHTKYSTICIVCKAKEMSEKKEIRIYSNPAGGWDALKAVGEALEIQGVAVSGAQTLLHMNQPQGFDCPGCGWPDPKHPSPFEFCENGAKAVAWEATTLRCTPEFFAQHTVSELASWNDYDLEMVGRLTHPMVYEAGSDRYVPIDWDDAFALVGDRLMRSIIPIRRTFIRRGAHRTKPRSCISSSCASSAATTFPIARTCVTKRQAWACRNRSASARERSCWKTSSTRTRSSSSARIPAPTARA
jgi:hypothetical protein